MRTVEGWLLELVSSVPEIRPLYDSAVELDPELFLERVSRWARKQGHTEPVARLLGVLELDYARRGAKVRGIIESSFVEPLATDPLVHHFGPNLRRATRPHALRHGDR